MEFFTIHFKKCQNVQAKNNLRTHLAKISGNPQTFLKLPFLIFKKFCSTSLTFANLFEFVLHNSEWNSLLYILKSVKTFKQRTNLRTHLAKISGNPQTSHLI